ncbi:SDR family oxidoreductase [Sphingomonas cavernae]|uniref:SDR family oxidoreductase n=1 Tax=Sphingomonas cavernae TaxID=2320861 RepID=A0A418W5V3_9SPHN|nr:SDR family oxidoreductase [Sphingomonas cavernae]
MTMPIFDFSGKKVFVFGGTSGINLGIAHAFARAGARLTVASRNPEKVEAARAALSHTHDALGYALDVRDFDAVKAAVDDHKAKRGQIDVLISGAAGNFPALASSLSPNGFKSVIDIDCIGTFHVMRAAYDALAKPGAAVINISAPQAFIPMALQAHVCAAKAGVDMITKTLAIEWGPEGVRVNSVSPGPIEGTEGMERLAPTPEAKKRSAESVPLKRMGTVDDVADVCLFLASDAARYVSGVVLPADGGWTAGRGFGGLG